MKLVWLSLAWLAGIYTGSRFYLSPLWLLLALLPVPAFWLVRKREAVIVSMLSLLLFTGAAIYSYDSLYSIDEGVLRFYNDRGSMELTAMIAEPPDVRDTNTRLVVDVYQVSTDEAMVTVKGKALVTVPRYPEYSYGDVLTLYGEPLTPPQFDDFDYAGYLSGRGIQTIMYYPHVNVVAVETGSAILSAVYSLREMLGRSLADILPEPHGSLAQGLLLGIRGSIPQDVNDAFARSGTAHLLAISGLHLGIITGLLLGLSIAIFGRRHGYYILFALGGIWLYAIISGLSPPVVRGAFMSSLFLGAEALGRQRSAFIALSLAAALMVGINPYILRSVSFQMSVLAMAGLCFIFPLLRDAGYGVARRLADENGFIYRASGFLIDTLSASLAALIGVWPLTLYYFGYVSLVSLPATLFTVPVLPFIVLTAGFAGFAGLIIPLVGQLAGWFAWPFLSWLLLVTEWFSFDNSTLVVDSIHPAVIVCYYVVVMAVIICISHRRRKHLASGSPANMRAGVDILPGFNFNKKACLLLLPLALTVVLIGAVTMPDDKLHVSFLDVGQGDAVLIRQGSQQILVDGGPAPQELIRGLSERMAFWDRTIELIILTHPHEDHLAGLVEVLRRYRVEWIIMPSYQHDSDLFREMERLIQEKNIPVTFGQTGQEITMNNGEKLSVLWPPAGYEGNIEETTLVLRLDAGEAGFLLTSDIPGDIERELIRRRTDLTADVLKVAHHGARDSSTPEFLSVVHPSTVVISCGKDNRFGHPHEETLARLSTLQDCERILRTDMEGHIDLTWDGEQLWLEPR